jgi:hypothetical protein
MNRGGVWERDYSPPGSICVQSIVHVNSESCRYGISPGLDSMCAWPMKMWSRAEGIANVQVPLNWELWTGILKEVFSRRWRTRTSRTSW